MLTIDKIQEKYPIYWSVWNNDFRKLQLAIDKTEHALEQLDPHRRTPRMLAVKLSHLERVKALLVAKCNANFECNGWLVVQEAVCFCDANILTSVLEVRDLQRHTKRVSHVPQLLQHLQDTPDFYDMFGPDMFGGGTIEWLVFRADRFRSRLSFVMPPSRSPCDVYEMRD
ncbi:hypothetical protein RP20_CCG015912 [Aedes albopictus]|nr:hypothetical protein RP20_CCG015912 [Aedes albopictus]